MTKSVEAMLRDCGPGQGVSVARYLPYWDVVARRSSKGTIEYIVTDSTLEKPLRVYGPTTETDARQWARTTSLLFLTITGSLIT